MSQQPVMKRYGYEYSPANKAYEIAPLGPDGELDWENELCVTAGTDDEEQAKLIVNALNQAADVEAVEADNVAKFLQIRNMISDCNEHCQDQTRTQLENNKLKHALAAKDQEANEREIFYAGVLNDAERERVSLRDQLAAKEASHEKDIRYLRGQYDSIVDIKDRIEAEKNEVIAQLQARVK